MQFKGILVRLGVWGAVALFAIPAHAQDEADLAKKLSNPISSLISLPMQGNYDSNIGPADDGERFSLNIQPVIPVDIGGGWNLISRTIVPIVAQDDILPGAGDQFGLGDVVQSVFFSPQAPTAAGLIWGVGPVFLLPTATDDLLGGGKLGLGVTGVALVQRGPWTIGGLANHIWSVAGEDNLNFAGGVIPRSDISTTFLQPFISYTTKDAWTFSLNTETTYDWEGENWAVPVNLAFSKLTRIGDQPVSIGAGVRYWVESSPGSPEGFGARLTFTFLFPR